MRLDVRNSKFEPLCKRSTNLGQSTAKTVDRSVGISTDKPHYTDTRYNDEIHHNNNLTVTKPPLRGNNKSQIMQEN